MESPSPSECGAADRNDSERDSARNDFRVDAKRKHQCILEDSSGRRSVGTRAFFIQGLVSALDSLTVG